MNSSELETFIVKFRNLWKAGLDAHLDIESHAGQAWVGLRVRLGPEPGPAQQHPPFPPHVDKKPEMVPPDNAVVPEELLQEQNKLSKVKNKLYKLDKNKVIKLDKLDKPKIRILILKLKRLLEKLQKVQ